MECKNNKLCDNLIVKPINIFMIALISLFLTVGASHVYGQTMLTKGDILVSEILFNPLPGGADYVELYNNTDNAVELSVLRLAKMVGDSVAKLYKIGDEGSVAPHDYVVVTTDAAYVTANYTVRYASRLKEVTSMPAYNDASGSVAVYTHDTVLLDRFDYDESMHSRLLRDREGVALERRSFHTGAEVRSNWYSASSTSGYGTPTYANSQSAEFLFVGEDFAVEHTLFSPDGDGYNDLLDITYDLRSCDLAANITVFDAHGRRIRQLLRGGMLGCRGVITWDGSDDAGVQCGRGSYVVVVEAYNEKGAKQSWRHTVSLVRNN